LQAQPDPAQARKGVADAKSLRGSDGAPWPPRCHDGQATSACTGDRQSPAAPTSSFPATTGASLSHAPPASRP